MSRIILNGARPARAVDGGLELFLAETAALPPLAQALVDLVGVVAEETWSPTAALAVLESDPRLVDLTVAALPPELGLQGLANAWSHLGGEALVGFALRAALLEHTRAWAPPGEPGPWRHALATAGACRALARAAGVAAPLLAYAAGALYRTGDLVAEHALRQGLGRRPRYLDPPRVDREALGAALLDRWGLPRAVVTAAGRRGDPMAPPLARLVSRAAVCARAAGFGTENADLTPLEFIPPPLDEGARAAVAEVNACEAMLAR